LVAANAQQVEEPRIDERTSSLVQRTHTKRDQSNRGMPPLMIRSIDGYGNNLSHPTWGSAGIEFVRTVPAAYMDGSSLAARVNAPSARAVSNAVFAQESDTKNIRQASDYLWLWGQFLDHDITETPIADPTEELDIMVPAGDPWFDPTGSGTATISLDRSAYHMVDNQRQQLNEITAFIDASNVYGSDAERAAELRSNDGSGRLKTSNGDLLPFNVNGFANAPTASDPSFFLAGDVRANEQISLTAMHTLFVREHNYWADQIGQENPELDGEQVYQRARSIVAAEMQRITYNEFLPVLLGSDAMPRYNGYREQVDPGITNVFATAAYRVGHTMLPSKLKRVDSDGNAAAEGDIALLNAFFSPDEISDNGIDSVLRGIGYQAAQDIDTKIIDDVRNFLFGPPGSGGFDLVSLNIQRGRDHGLGSYNDVRDRFNLDRIESWDDFGSDSEVRSAFAGVYDSTDDIDPWAGMLAEPHRQGALVGETHFRVLRDQFRRLRDADRFWYEASLPPQLIQQVEQTSLADIIRRNTSIGDELQTNVFRVHPTVAADITGDGQLNFHDIAAWVQLFNDRDPRADFNLDNRINFFDLTRLIEVITGS
ncbi:MAG: peroxidase family protein, partial [Phycisphaerales bacterium]